MSQKGLSENDLNTLWSGDQFESEKRAFLWSFSKIQKEGYGTDRCVLCGQLIPSGEFSTELLTEKISHQLPHFIEFHGHQPTLAERQVVEKFYKRYKDRCLESGEQELVFLKRSKK